MKVLNLYAGIGGNRKLWQDVKVTAVEIKPEIAAIYQNFFPKDKVVIGDAHQYILDNFSKFDFIWSSPPCQTHSRMNLINVSRKFHFPRFVDMNLWQEIVFLKKWFKGKFCVENVITYYKPLLKPTCCGNHYLWTNFLVHPIKQKRTKIANFKKRDISANEIANGHKIKVDDWHGFKGNRAQIINNCIEPELGLHIFNESKRDVMPELFREVSHAKPR